MENFSKPQFTVEIISEGIQQ